jgi:prophage regulatory protein
MSKRILRKPDVLKKVGVSKTQLQTLIDTGEFPGTIKLGGPNARAIGWIESEVDAWIDQKIAERDAALVGGAV